jgi:hypothetical protein
MAAKLMNYPKNVDVLKRTKRRMRIGNGETLCSMDRLASTFISGE